ncbi:MAG: chromosome segregation protein SMC, partial [Rhodobacteraceae bacterium]|nr:chromosome segregation protein SMC [Paracoccaceae bacterium]
LVRQGQISELINAKPQSRRRILEEAAGISGLYQRRHEAELKLRATEANLERVEDVVEQLAGQLSQLARQAKQAARYRALGEELRAAEGVLLYRRWREADQALAAAREVLKDRRIAASRAEAASRAAVTAREAAEAALPPLREEETIAGAVLQRLEVERDTLVAQEDRARAEIKTLEARLAQLTRDRDREAGLNSDAAQTLARLADERGGLEAANEGHDAALAAAAAEAEAAAEVLGDREAALTALTEDVARLAARHQAVERLLADSRKTLDRSEAETAKARDAVAQARDAVAAGAAAEAQARAAQDRAEADLAAAETALAAADMERTRVQAAEAEARAARSEAEGEAKALEAEVAALRRLVARDAGSGAQVLDDVRVAPGFEKAFGAALGDDLKAPVLGAGPGSGWAALPGYDAAPALPGGVTALGDHVTVPGVLQRRMAQIGVVAAADAARLQPLLQPGQRLVSPEGDLWRWDGYCARAEDAPSAAALRLEQLNRLDGLERALADAQAKAGATRAAHGGLAADLTAAAAADKDAREARRRADGALADASRALSRAEADRNLAEGRVDSLSLAVARHDEAAGAARQQLRDAERQAEGLADLAEARAQVADVRTTVEAARITMMARRTAHDERRREGVARASRLAAIAKDAATWQTRLENAETRMAEFVQRLEQTETALSAAQAAPEDLAARRADLARAITDAAARKAAALDAVTGADRALRAATDGERSAERAASDAREARAGAEARVEAAAESTAAAEARIREDLDLSPAALLDTLQADPAQMPSAEEVETTIARLRRSRDALGAVNLRAEEDAKEVQTEHDTLVTERADLETAIGKLRAGISGLNREGRERLLTAFEEVNGSFGTLFTHLFGGGEAKLALVESDDPLEAGLEILCQPPGKKLSTLSLLSGGEQTLTALALIFAVFLANPAPICVLDEVDAPLDDANVTRFCDLLDEMTRRTQTRFLIITHHAVTMSRMDRLFGVTMAEQGVSQLVSVDLKKAEAMVA